jgi:WD40 repeat protein
VRNLVCRRPGEASPVHALAFGTVPGEGQASRGLLACGGADGSVTVWDPLTGALACGPLAGHDGWVASVAFTTDTPRRVLLASGGGTTVCLWDVAAGTRVTTLRRRDTVSALAAAGPLLAIGSDEGVSVVGLPGPQCDGPAPRTHG